MSLTQIFLFPIALGTAVGQFFGLITEDDDPITQENGFRILIE